MRTVRTVEQGMGRSVRGEKDYSVIVVTGSDLVRLVREKGTRRFLSPQMDKQIQIGLDVAEMARQDVADGEEPAKAFTTLVRQCLRRDPNWKAYYAEQMDGVVPRGPNESVLKLYAAELAAEEAYIAGDYGGASDRLQRLMDEATSKTMTRPGTYRNVLGIFTVLNAPSPRNCRSPPTRETGCC